MKLKFKEEPKEWRKSAFRAALGLAIFSSLVRWRMHLPPDAWCMVLAVCGLFAIAAWLRPRWFRGWYRLSLRLGFYSSQFFGHCVLLLLFIFILTPFAFVLRLMGKDPLQLKRRHDAKTCWCQARDCNPLDRLF